MVCTVVFCMIVVLLNRWRLIVRIEKCKVQLSPDEDIECIQPLQLWSNSGAFKDHLESKVTNYATTGCRPQSVGYLVVRSNAKANAN